MEGRGAVSNPPLKEQIVMPKSVVVDGRTWHLFCIEFTTADGKYATYIYALSEEHAAAIVLELKETARLSHQFIGVIPA
jgi:hypothetical protein